MMSSYSLAAFSLLLLMSTPLGTAVPLSSFYTYGTKAGDSVLNRTDDGTSESITLPSSLRIFGKSYRTLFVSPLHVVRDARCMQNDST